MKVLLIEDDRILGVSLKDFLVENGFDCHLLSDDREFEQYFLLNEYDVILLDLMLKFNKGENLLKKIKQKKDVPVIVITAKSGIEDKEQCFLAGADDYVVKPFEPKELIFRINAVVKRYIENGYFIEVDERTKIDLKRGIIKKGGDTITLTKREWDLLYILAKNRGKVVSNECIINYVWQDNPVGTESIRTYVKKLREILGKSAIETHKGRGYKLK